MKKLMFVVALVLLIGLSAVGFAEVSGITLDYNGFYEMEHGFRDRVFDREVSVVGLSEEENFMFIPDEVDHLLPSLVLTNEKEMTITDDIDAMVQTVGTLIQTAQALQQNFPSAFIFNQTLVEAHAENGLGYAIADQTIWLWAEDEKAVMLPIYFYDNGTGDLVDNVYLLTAVAPNNGANYYAFYNEGEIVDAYLQHVTLNPDESVFQLTVSQWLAGQTDGAAAGEASEEENPAAATEAPTEASFAAVMDEEQLPEPDGQGTYASVPNESGYIGNVIVSKAKAYVRVEGKENAKTIATVRKGTEYPVLSISENGWYEIEVSEGKIGFIHPNTVDYSPNP